MAASVNVTPASASGPGTLRPCTIGPARMKERREDLLQGEAQAFGAGIALPRRCQGSEQGSPHFVGFRPRKRDPRSASQPLGRLVADRREREGRREIEGEGLARLTRGFGQHDTAASLVDASASRRDEHDRPCPPRVEKIPPDVNQALGR